MSDQKLIRIRFPYISASDEQKIRKYLNEAIISKAAQVDDLDESNIRQDVRVMFFNKVVKAVTEASETLPMQSFMTTVKDLSSGGACISIDKNRKVVKNGQITLYLDFIQTGFKIEGQILGKK